MLENKGQTTLLNGLRLNSATVVERTVDTGPGQNAAIVGGFTFDGVTVSETVSINNLFVTLTVVNDLPLNGGTAVINGSHPSLIAKLILEVDTPEVNCKGDIWIGNTQANRVRVSRAVLNIGPDVFAHG